MTLPRSVAEVLAEHVTFEVECIDRMYLNVYRPGVAARPGGGRVLHAAPRGPVRVVGADGPDLEAFVADIHRFVADRGVPLVRLRQGATQRRRRPRVPGRLRAAPRGSLFVGRAQEKTHGVPHREAPQPGHRGDLSVDRARHGDGQPLLLLRPSTTTSAVLPQVLHLLPLQRQAVHQRPRVGQAPGGQGRDRLRGARQRVRRRDDQPARLASDLRPARAGQDRRLAAQVAGPAAASVHRRRPPPATATTSRSCRPSSP